MPRTKSSPLKCVVSENGRSKSWVLILPNDFLSVGKETNGTSDMVKLRHPRSGSGTMFLFSSDNSMVQEVFRLSEKRSWFINDSVTENGTMHFSTPVDPLFLVLPYLKKSKEEGKVVPLEDLLIDDIFPATRRLHKSVAERLHLVADKKGSDDLNAWVYNEDKALKWLCMKTKKVADILKEKHINVGGNATSKNFIKSAKKDCVGDEESYLKYAIGLVAEYLTKDLILKLSSSLKLPEEVLENSGMNKRKPSAAGEEENEKKTKKMKRDEAAEASEQKPKALSAKEKALKKAAGGSKSITSFFKKVPSGKATTAKKPSSIRSFSHVTQTLHLVRNATRSMGYSGPGEKVMYPRKCDDLQKDAVVGGRPISEELAVELRHIVFGASMGPPRGEWLRTGFVFREPEQEFAFGLKGNRNSTRGLLSVVQAYLVKHFLFEKKQSESLAPEMLLKPNRSRQVEGLWSALASILWNVGEKKESIVCLPRGTPALQHSSSFFADGLTEYVHLFEFTAIEDLRAFLKRYVYIFLQEGGPGALLLLYSAVVTRGAGKVRADMEDDKQYLLSCEEEGSGCIITLLLTGRATPYLHNGVVYVGDEDHYAMPQWGVMTRSDIGFLIYHDSADCKNLEESKQPGSRLKTPSFPVWVINCSGHYGVLYNTNSELLRNYHAERRFDLHYFSVGGNHLLMSIDTRYHDRQCEGRDNGKGDDNPMMTSSPIEKLIHTKWQDAHINFNGMTPTI